MTTQNGRQLSGRNCPYARRAIVAQSRHSSPFGIDMKSFHPGIVRHFHVSDLVIRRVPKSNTSIRRQNGDPFSHRNKGSRSSAT